MDLFISMSREADSEVMCIRYSQDGCLLAAGYADGYVKVSTASY